MIKEMPEKPVTMRLVVPKRLHSAFKVKCATSKRNTPMNQKIFELMEKWTKENKRTGSFLDLLELIGCSVSQEMWYDEEGVEGTRIIIPNGDEYTIFGHGDDCDIDELILKIKEGKK